MFPASPGAFICTNAAIIQKMGAIFLLFPSILYISVFQYNSYLLSDDSVVVALIDKNMSKGTYRYPSVNLTTGLEWKCDLTNEQTANPCLNSAEETNYWALERW